MTTLRFTIPIAPVPCGRPRAFVRPGAKHASMHMPDRTIKYERAARLVAQAAASRHGWTPGVGPYAVWLDVYRDVRRGDADNYAKAACDAMVGPVFEDDRHVLELHVRLGHDKTNPRTEVLVKVIQ